MRALRVAVGVDRAARVAAPVTSSPRAACCLAWQVPWIPPNTVVEKLYASAVVMVGAIWSSPNADRVTEIAPFLSIVDEWIDLSVVYAMDAPPRPARLVGMFCYYGSR